ncbi:TniQ family protein [Paraburkholderia sp. BL25I1N1]|uniref:TniQ family protein n=1 Tax=Paraburkholderia sp. BL25I1N1 TaxID=1938804 RepID=UPI000D079F2E|nr:TniQ family protein [Paraburkholderia sp. BL25I1N1]PRY09111.1 TniQ protein [Paraburkholderia sp. BL25I1N1]
MPNISRDACLFEGLDSPEREDARRVGALYDLIPQGLGEGHCESLVSYLRRLAFAHGVSVDDLVIKVLSSYSSVDFAIWRHFSTWSRRSSINIYTPQRTVPLRDALLQATGVQSLGLLSFATLEGVIDLSRMSSAIERYCPMCDDSVPFDQVSHPMLWDLKMVSCCPVHAVRLVPNTCGKDISEHRSRWCRIHLPGVCVKCGALAYRCNRQPQLPATSTEMWIARQSAALIAAISGGERFSANSLREGIVSMASVVGGGYPFRAASQCGINKARLHDWIHGVRPIGYSPLLALVAAAGVDLLDVMRGAFEPKEVIGFRYSSCPRRKQTQASDELRQKIQTALDDPDCPSVTAVSALLGCDRSTLKKLYPLECSQLVVKWQSKRSSDTRKRRAEAFSEMSAIAETLRSAGKEITVRNVWIQSGVLAGKGSRYEAALRVERDKGREDL